MEPVIENILQNLNLMDKIFLASTNTVVKNKVFSHCKDIKAIEERGSFNLDILPDMISDDEILTVFKVFPNLRKLKFDLRFCNDIIQNIKIFKNLEKISVYLFEYACPKVFEEIEIKNLTIRQQYYITKNDSVINLLQQIKNLEKFSIYNGKLTTKSLNKLNSYKLKSLKIQNTAIEGLDLDIVLEIIKNENLKVLQSTSEKYFRYPGPTRLIHYLLDLCPYHDLNIQKLVFTLDFRETVKYENLIKIRGLQEVKIYYSALFFTQNLETIIKAAKHLENTQFQFIEFLEIPMCCTNNLYSHILEGSMRFMHKINFLSALHNTRNTRITPIYHESWMVMRQVIDI